MSYSKMSQFDADKIRSRHVQRKYGGGYLCPMIEYPSIVRDQISLNLNVYRQSGATEYLTLGITCLGRTREREVEQEAIEIRQEVVLNRFKGIVTTDRTGRQAGHHLVNFTRDHIDATDMTPNDRHRAKQACSAWLHTLVVEPPAPVAAPMLPLPAPIGPPGQLVIAAPPVLPLPAPIGAPGHLVIAAPPVLPNQAPDPASVQQVIVEIAVAAPVPAPTENTAFAAMPVQPTPSPQDNAKKSYQNFVSSSKPKSIHPRNNHCHGNNNNEPACKRQRHHDSSEDHDRSWPNSDDSDNSNNRSGKRKSHNWSASDDSDTDSTGEHPNNTEVLTQDEPNSVTDGLTDADVQMCSTTINTLHREILQKTRFRGANSNNVANFLHNMVDRNTGTE